MDIVIVNARIWTGETRRPWADAVAIQGERIAAVGSSAEVMKRAGGARIIDAKGAMIVPGIEDGRLGVLKAGLPADLVMIDRDLARVAPETIRQATAILTMVSGEIVFER